MLVDLTGHKFGRWEVVGRAETPSNGKGRYWLCECDCSHRTGTKVMSTSKINETKGIGVCGHCYGEGPKRGMSTSSIYGSWRGMKERCNNPNHASYSTYGGRGVTVCQRWQHSFTNFAKDMGDRPRGHSLDRINPEGNYEPSNCRWASPKVQGQNRREYVLTDSQKAAAIELSAKGAPLRLISAAMGVARSHLANIINGKS